MNAIEIAEICHEANRAYCHALGDFSQKIWDQAPEWQRESAVNGVEFRLQHQDAPASASHEQWLEHKQHTGWVYGPVKDEAKKEHPCFVPFDQLPLAQQKKDELFAAIVKALS